MEAEFISFMLMLFIMKVEQKIENIPHIAVIRPVMLKVSRVPWYWFSMLSRPVAPRVIHDSVLFC